MKLVKSLNVIAANASSQLPSRCIFSTRICTWMVIDCSRLQQLRQVYSLVPFSSRWRNGHRYQVSNSAEGLD